MLLGDSVNNLTNVTAQQITADLIASSILYAYCGTVINYEPCITLIFTFLMSFLAYYDTKQTFVVTHGQ